MSPDWHFPQLGLPPAGTLCNFCDIDNLSPNCQYTFIDVSGLSNSSYEFHTILTNGINWLFVDLNENLFWDFPQSIFDSRSLGVCLFFRGVVYKIFSGWVVIEVQLYLANKTERIIRIVDSRAFSVLCKPKVPYH